MMDAFYNYPGPVHTNHAQKAPLSEKVDVNLTSPVRPSANESPLNEKFIVVRYRSTVNRPETTGIKRRIDFTTPEVNPVKYDSDDAIKALPKPVTDPLRDITVQHPVNQVITVSLNPVNNITIPCTHPPSKKQKHILHLQEDKIRVRRQRNVRERLRIRRLNQAFDVLKSCLPNNDCVMPKLDVVCSAIKYMRNLQELLS